MSDERIEKLQKQIAELRSRWPAHSVPPAMAEELDELEEELDKQLKKAAEEEGDAKADGHGRL